MYSGILVCCVERRAAVQGTVMETVRNRGKSAEEPASQFHGFGNIGKQTQDHFRKEGCAMKKTMPIPRQNVTANPRTFLIFFRSSTPQN